MLNSHLAKACVRASSSRCVLLRIACLAVSYVVRSIEERARIMITRHIVVPANMNVASNVTLLIGEKLCRVNNVNKDYFAKILPGALPGSTKESGRVR